MSPQVDISGWPNIDQVAAVTGISRRTLERELAAHKWQTRKRARPPKKPEVVFDPEQVQARMPQPVSSVQKHSASVSELAETQESGMGISEIAEVVAAVMERFLGALGQSQSRDEDKPQALYVDLEGAAEFSGLSIGCLRRLVREGRLPHQMDADKSRHYTVVKVKRADLEAL